MDQEKLAQLLKATFLEEMQEHVAKINRELMALEKEPSQHERIELLTVLFRSAHTLKGSSRAVNALPIEAACHEFEEVLTAIRDKRIALTPELFALLFATADAIEETGMWLREEQDLSTAPLNELIPKLQQAAQGIISQPTSPPAVMNEAMAESVAPVTPPAQSSTADWDHQDDVGGGKALPAVTQTNRDIANEDVPAEDISADRVSRDEARRQSAAGMVRVAAIKLDSLLAKSGELLVARRRIASRSDEVAELRDLVTTWKNEWQSFDKVLREQKSFDVDDNSLRRQLPLSRRTTAALTCNRDRLRKLEKRLDRLVSTIQADGRYLDATCDALDDEVHQVRMLPFAEACQGLERAARDVARETGKKVDLIIEDNDVEIDRSVLEGLKDPLLHLVRNAVDHGIEAPEKRTTLGKPATGVIAISAELRGAEVEIVVSDDGGGVDLDRVREKIRQKGLPEPVDEAGLLRMLFHASFSTAAIVTDISGRGVGLDVVQNAVESLHGTVQIVFEPDQGTQFIIRVPLTLTKIRTVMVVANGQTYGIATSSVEQLVRFSPDQIGSMSGHNVLLLGDAPIPIAPLADTLGFATKSPHGENEKRLAIVVSAGGQRAGLVVDDVLSEQEIVVKSLGARIHRIRQLSGAALLPSGRVALVLNITNVIPTALGTGPSTSWDADHDDGPSLQKVLIIDDSLTTRTLMKSILETAGYTVEVAVDGLDAWQKIQESRPEVVVSDVDMPNMDGFELTSRIRKSPLSDLPIILVTARQTDEDRIRGIQAGADAYILKSAFDQHNLLATIAQLL